MTLYIEQKTTNVQTWHILSVSSPAHTGSVPPGVLFPAEAVPLALLVPFFFPVLPFIHSSTHRRGPRPTPRTACISMSVPRMLCSPRRPRPFTDPRPTGRSRTRTVVPPRAPLVARRIPSATVPLRAFQLFLLFLEPLLLLSRRLAFPALLLLWVQLVQPRCCAWRDGDRVRPSSRARTAGGRCPSGFRPRAKATEPKLARRRRRGASWR